MGRERLRNSRRLRRGLTMLRNADKAAKKAQELNKLKAVEHSKDTECLNENQVVS